MKLSSLAKKRIIAGMAAIIVVVAFYIYSNVSIQQKLAPTNVVFTMMDIPPHTQITKEMVVERVVPSQGVPPNAIRSVNDVVGKWTVEGYGISKNSLVYQSKVLETNEMPDAAVLNLKENEYAFPLLVDLETSSGNALMPDSYVDIYFATNETETRQPLTGKLFERIRITSVKDSKTQNVFSADNYTESNKQNNNQQIASSTNNPNTVAKLYTLAVTEEQLDLLTKAKLLGNIIPVANGKSYGETVSDVNHVENAIGVAQEYILNNSYNQFVVGTSEEVIEPAKIPKEGMVEVQINPINNQQETENDNKDGTKVAKNTEGNNE